MGFIIWKPTLEFTAEDYSSVMSTNLESVFHSCQLAHPLLKASGDGSIVSISSIAGVVGFLPGVVYGGSKGMLIFCAHISSFFLLLYINVMK